MNEATVQRYAEMAKAAGDLKREAKQIEAWTDKADDARRRLLELENSSEGASTYASEATVTWVEPEPVPEPVTQ